MKLCVFQGTFNPLHKAHLRIADYAIKKYEFDKLLFIPAYKPPHKAYEKFNSIHRLNMVKLALSGISNSKMEVSDIEYKREDKSYTYITVKNLYDIYNIDDKIYFLIGTDAFKNIESWYEADKLKKLVTFIVFKRENNCNFADFDYLKTKGYDFICEDLPFDDISSTELRKRIMNNKSYDDFVSKNVKEYIEKNGLYK